MNKDIARKKAKSIVSQMTVYEKLSQLLYNSPAIERLGIHEYNWWNEAAHGVARAGIATVFPQAIAMAATFDPELVGNIASAVSTEARAKYNKSVQYGDRDIYKGLTFWTPNINIFRDPRWGRGQETFGEDPFLTARLGVEYIKGLQGEGEFLKSAACAKHFAVHSGPEKLRHTFDAKATPKDMSETYLPAFEHAVKAGVAGVMGAYNRTNGEPCCAHSKLMEEILFKNWGFDGYFVSDCGAIYDISENHKFAPSLKEGAAIALKRGCNLNCGEAYASLVDAYEEDIIDEDDITNAAEKLYTIRVLLGEFEDERPYSDIGLDKLDSKEHKALNLKASRESMVLLKNEDGYLPLKNMNGKKIAVIGPNATSKEVLEGNYNGYASEYITVADGIRKVFADSNISVATGSHLIKEAMNRWEGGLYQHSEGMAAANDSDVAILCLGLDRSVEGEEIVGLDNDFTDGGDKKTLLLPKTQMRLAEAVCDVCENVIVVVMCGSAVDLGEKVRNHAKAIIHGWYPGAQGGLALAQLLSGEASPCGKLPLTFYKADTELSPITDYSLQGKTYRYYNGEPLYPFGYGLSYGKTSFSDLKITAETEEEYSVAVTVENESGYPLCEKVQVYAQFTESRTLTPNFQLCGIKAVELLPGEKKVCEINVSKYWLCAVDVAGNRIFPDGSLKLYAGSHQPDKRSCELCNSQPLCITVK